MATCPKCKTTEIWWGKYDYGGRPCPDCVNGDLEEVWEYGAKHHKKDNKWYYHTAQEHVEAADRHIAAWMSGELIDPDSGLSHIDLARVRLEMAKFCELVKASYEE